MLPLNSSIALFTASWPQMSPVSSVRPSMPSNSLFSCESVCTLSSSAA
jgi:hypothetical protein